MAYIRKIHVENCRNVASLDIDLSPRDGDARPRHLILTGPNGSGKSGVLEAVATEVDCAVRGQRHPLEAQESSLRVIQDDPTQSRLRALNEEAIAKTRRDRPAIVDWQTSVDDVAEDFSVGKFIAAYLPARRALNPTQVQGPRSLGLTPTSLRPATSVAEHLLQFLVNKRTEQAYASVEGDAVSAEALERWYQGVVAQLRRVFDDDGLEVVFDRRAFNFSFKGSDGHLFDLTKLADGHAAYLAIFAEILLRIDAAQEASGDRTAQPTGVVIIDEIETHLHLKLQEDILPFLTTVFPRIQFIVATHSPVVLTSVPGAVVYDMGKKEAAMSEDLRGLRFGSLMTGHFGLADDVDVDSMLKLKRLQALAGRPRSQDEEAKMLALAGDLAGRSPTMALEVWMATNGQVDGRKAS
jgi:hypothetical protein